MANSKHHISGPVSIATHTQRWPVPLEARAWPEQCRSPAGSTAEILDSSMGSSRTSPEDIAPIVEQFTRTGTTNEKL